MTPFWLQDKTVLQLKDVGVSGIRYLFCCYMSKNTPHILDSLLPLRLWIQNIVQMYHKNLLRIIIQTNYHKLPLLKIIPLFSLLSLGIWKHIWDLQIKYIRNRKWWLPHVTKQKEDTEVY